MKLKYLHRFIFFPKDQTSWLNILNKHFCLVSYSKLYMQMCPLRTFSCYIYHHKTCIYTPFLLIDTKFKINTLVSEVLDFSYVHIMHVSYKSKHVWFLYIRGTICGLSSDAFLLVCILKYYVCYYYYSLYKNHSYFTYFCASKIVPIIVFIIIIRLLL